MDFDLDAITGKKRYIKFLERKVEIKDLTVDEFLKATALIDDLQSPDEFDGETIDVATHVSNNIGQYLCTRLDLTEEEVKKITFRQFKALQNYLGELELIDQGFSKEEAQRMLGDATKKKVSQTTGF